MPNSGPGGSSGQVVLRIDHAWGWGLLEPVGSGAQSAGRSLTAPLCTVYPMAGPEHQPPRGGDSDCGGPGGA